MAQWTLDADVGIVCEVAFTTGPLDTPSWTDVSAFLDRSWTSFRGKESEEDEMQPGFLTVHLDNSARTFDPEHSAGPYFGNLKPMKKIRLRVAVGAFSAVIFQGYVLGWPQDWGTFKSVAAIPCVDGSRVDGLLGETAFSTEVLADSPIGYWPLQGGEYRSGLPGGIELRPQSKYYEVTPPSVVDKGLPLGGPEAFGFVGTTTSTTPVGIADDPNLTATPAIEAWISGDDVSGNNLTFRAAVTSSDWIVIGVGNFLGLYAGYSNVSSNLRLTASSIMTVYDDFPAAGGMHHVAAYRSGSNFVVMLDGSIVFNQALVAGTVALGGTPEGIPGYRIAVQRTSNTDPSASISHAIAYTTAPSEARFRAHYEAGKSAYSGELGGARMNRALDLVGWPSGDRDISTGLTTQGPFIPASMTALSYIHDVERSEHPGLVFFSRDNKLTFRDRQWLWTRTPAVTFKDDGTGTDYVASNPRGNDVSTIRNVVTVSYASVGGITNRDQSSVDDYGEQPPGGELIQCPTMAFAQDASNLGRFRVRTRGQPQTIIPSLMSEMVPSPETQIPSVLALELGDVVEFQRKPMNVGSTITKRFLVLGIGHEVTAEQWTVTLYLSPPILSAESAPYLTAGDATRGKVGAAFGNIVPF